MWQKDKEKETVVDKLRAMLEAHEGKKLSISFHHNFSASKLSNYFPAFSEVGNQLVLSD